ncbi:MAG: LSU ribosomal protein L5p (L11e), partial [uncultured Solirubrobacteraceae bacterium]
GPTEDPIQRRDPPRAHRALRLLVLHAGPEARQGRREHGAGRRQAGLEGPRQRDGAARDDRRPEAERPPRPQVHRPVQGPRRHARRRGRDPARRARLRVPRPPHVGRHPPYPRLPRPQADVVRRPRQLRHGRARADDLPRDRLRRDRRRPRHGHHHRHDRPHRRRGLRAARGLRDAVRARGQPVHPDPCGGL